MFICEDCGHTFVEPSIVDNGFEHAFGYEKVLVSVCPNCLEPSYKEADQCQCGEFIRRGERLCKDCRKDLLARICDFADTLTYEEEKLFNDWMEESGIEERKKWE